MLTMGFFSFQGARLLPDSMDEDELHTLQMALDLSYGESNGDGAGEGGSSHTGTSSVTELVDSGTNGADGTGAELGLTQPPNRRSSARTPIRSFVLHVAPASCSAPSSATSAGSARTRR